LSLDHHPNEAKTPCHAHNAAYRPSRKLPYTGKVAMWTAVGI